MSTPQLENGFTQLSNELLEAVIRFGFGKRELTLLLALIRATYGFKKKEDDMTFQQLEGWTGIKRSHCSETMRDLDARNIVLIRDGRRGYVIGLNKNYRQWQASQNGTGVPKQDADRPKTGQLGVPKQDAPKKDCKRNTQKKECPIAIDTFLAECREAGESPVAAGDAVFTYADETGIPHEFLRLCWREFVERNRARGKRYKSWRQAFRNCVRENWYRLWWIGQDGQYALTTTGVQAANRNRAAEEAKRNAAA